MWMDIGIALELADDDDGEFLDGLGVKMNGDDMKCMMEVFKKWLRESKSKRPATCNWSHLLQVLKAQNAAGKMDSYLGKTTFE